MVRLDKFLADASVGTRSEVKKYLKSKRISVNGLLSVRPELKIDPDTDRVCMDGKPVNYTRFLYYLFHKPAGCVTARTDALDRTVLDYFPEELRGRLSPVGRLDKDTEGFLLLTNDGVLNHRLTSPSYHLKKTYFAELDQPVPADAVWTFAQGVDIGDDRPTLPAELCILPSMERDDGPVYSAELTITEGRYHQVKRMFQAIGLRVTYLKRISMGSLTLGQLPKGEYRLLTENEMERLKQECETRGLLP